MSLEGVSGSVLEVCLFSKVFLPLVGLVVAAVLALAPLLAHGVAGVGGVGRGLAIRLPDVHLNAAGAVVPMPGVHVVVAAGPLVAVGLAVDEFEVVGALGVAVAGAVRRTGLK